MPSAAISSYGTQLSMGAYGGGLTAIAELMDLGGPNVETGTEEVTPHGSDGWKGFIATLTDGGEVTFDINMVPASASVAALWTALTDKTKRSFEAQWPDAGSTTWPFTGLVTNFDPQAPVEGKLSASLTIKVTESITPA